ncbi:hypothetical protein [Acetobacter persici]|uniref:hypothetical protein n=1 Tax=Acetobacter persici TaxID=1076596 RepID=UPI0039EC9379
MLFVANKKGDGVDNEAEKRCLGWLLLAPNTDTYIHVPTKRNVPDGSDIANYPHKQIFKEITKKNTVKSGNKIINLFFGNGKGHSGILPALGYSGKILCLYDAPEDIQWIQEKYPNADICLVPWMDAEVQQWLASFNPTIL